MQLREWEDKMWLNRLLISLFGDKVRNILLFENREKEIMQEMIKIPNIYDYWELQRQAGYQLYGKTNDKKYLGWVEQANHILINLNNLKADVKEEPLEDNGFESQYN